MFNTVNHGGIFFVKSSCLLPAIMVMHNFNTCAYYNKSTKDLFMSLKAKSWRQCPIQKQNATRRYMKHYWEID